MATETDKIAIYAQRDSLEVTCSLHIKISMMRLNDMDSANVLIWNDVFDERQNVGEKL